ncbi:TIGR04255 family protein [Rhizobium sp. SA279]|uniref:TIGR04255 family protein n=1 Tax=Agrobacterium deltaense TaxID=1183412 RepID=UPI000F642331|nr:TIGR04255 family protein [Agrobacterium deltaense]RRN75574.1 TIGR04255 family protein [Agrobacterium deltaense]
MNSDRRVADFSSPPLDEVVLGVQFTPLNAYSTVNAGDVWRLFSSEFPIVSEQVRLQPQFEVFGGIPQGELQINFGPDLRNRLWFIAEDDSHLLQFQDDRLLINWRRRTSGMAYPHHEKMSALFKEYLLRLETYVRSDFKGQLEINQAEVSYINIIPSTDLNKIGEFLKIFNLDIVEVESISTVFTEVIASETKQPVGRLIHEFQTVWSMDGKNKAIRWTLTFRGKPPKDNIDSAIEFISFGRELIVNRFCAITTDKAHEIWGRYK